MQLLFTLDYELFMGAHAGTVDSCLIRPLDKYIEAAADSGMRFTIFVDAAYLHALRRLMSQHACLKDDFSKVEQHLQRLQHNGHDIQLHIHPQWYYSDFDGNEWHLDTKHYKLADMPHTERTRLVKESKAILDNIIGKPTMAFRAGGFSAQPTSMLTELFDVCALTTDSSVCPGERYDSPFQQYDFSTACSKPFYRFSDDICTEQAGGSYTEVPVSTYKIGQAFHWRLATIRLIEKFAKSTMHHTYGDGVSVRTTSASIVHRLTHSATTIATIDGYKISFLKDAIDEYAKRGHRAMCIIGHPKLATPYSVSKLRGVCDYAKRMGHEFITLSQLTTQALNQ